MSVRPVNCRIYSTPSSPKQDRIIKGAQALPGPGVRSQSWFGMVCEGILERIQKRQGHETRAPEGMSILAFLWISPFLRYLTPLTILSINDLGHSESSLIYIMRCFTGVFLDKKLPERCLRFHSLETPPVPYFKLHKRAYGIEISTSLRFCHFPFANRYRLYQRASIVPKPQIGSRT